MLKSALKSLWINLFLFAVIPLSAATFDELVKNFVVLQASNGKQYLTAAVQLDGGTYVVTSQSLFFNPIPKFRLKSFSGKNLKYSGMEVSKLGDVTRIKLEDSKDVTGFPYAAKASGGKKVYCMNPETGIVKAANAGGGNLNNNKFKCIAGAPVLDSKGQFVGVVSRTDDGFGKNIEMKVFPLQQEEKWQDIKTISLAKQVYAITQLREFTKALDFTRDKNKRKGFMVIDTDTHPKLMGWTKEQNQKAFDNITAKKLGKKAQGNALREHASRCFHYASIKRLCAFYSSNAQQAKKGRWCSAYLKNQAKKVYDINASSSRALKNTMKSMMEMYPSIKAKL